MSFLLGPPAFDFLFFSGLVFLLRRSISTSFPVRCSFSYFVFRSSGPSHVWNSTFSLKPSSSRCRFCFFPLPLVVGRSLAWLPTVLVSALHTFPPQPQLPALFARMLKFSLGVQPPYFCSIRGLLAHLIYPCLFFPTYSPLWFFVPQDLLSYAPFRFLRSPFFWLLAIGFLFPLTP